MTNEEAQREPRADASAPEEAREHARPLSAAPPRSEAIPALTSNPGDTIVLEAPDTRQLSAEEIARRLPPARRRFFAALCETTARRPERARV